MSLVDRLLRDNIRTLTPYASARSDVMGGDMVLLDANENAFASSGPDALGRYPDPLQTDLKEAIGRLRRVSPERIFVGNGSDEAIDLLIRAFCRPGRDEIMVMPPTYGMYEVAATINDVAVNRVRLDTDFDLDLDTTRDRVNRRTRLMFLCSPNNPTGNRLDSERVARLLEWFDGFVVMDEAYIDFCETAGWLPLLNDFENLVVLQTLSKAWGLAGIRTGMAFGSSEVIDVLNRIKPPYNVSRLSQSAAIYTLGDSETMRERVGQIVAERKRLETALSDLAAVDKVFASEANFLLVRFVNAPKVFAYLRDNGIVVRDRSSMPGCEGSLRITVGTPDQNRRLLDVLTAREVTT
jgi:histidinol-phosphate aminotransferase